MVRGRLNFTIERSKDAAAIKTLATDPSIFPHIADDYHADPQAWEPPTSDVVVTLLARDEQDYFGFGIFIPRTWACFDAHMAFLPRSYGEQALASFKMMLDWMWKHSTAARLVGEIRSENRRAIAFAKRAGFVEYGVNPKSYLLGGVLRDQVCLGISRP